MIRTFYSDISVESWSKMAPVETIAGSVLAGVLADVMGRTAARIARAADPLGKSKAKRSRRLQDKLRTLDLFANLQTKEILGSLPDGVSLQEVTAALNSPQGKAVVSQLVAARITAPGVPTPGQVVYAMSLVFSPTNLVLAQAIADVLAGAVDDSLSDLETIDGDAAQDLRQTAGASLIASTVQSVHAHAETAELYSDPQRIAALAVWEQSYRAQIRLQHGHIVPPDFEQKRKVPLNDLYVAPQFRKLGPSQGGREERTDIQAFHSSLDRSVLLGDPGGGKSTASAWIATTAASNPATHVPFIVTLRDYAREPNLGSSIADFIAQQAAAFYQCKPPTGAIEYLLATGRALVIFDGLDELLDTSRRREMTGRVESFSQNYPQAPILVTSRRVGYAEASLDPAVFETYSIAGFNDSDVSQYVERWFRHVDDQDGERLAATCTSFLAEAKEIRDLTATPLILSLLCIIYRGQGYMPKNRPLVYEKCANLLFERWDSSRQIDVSLRVASQVDNAMKHLALWMLTSDQSGGGVLREELVTEAASFLSNVVEEATECRAAAIEFVDFCKGRAWVLSDAGTTAEGDELYKFTHRTFMEYFAAYELTRKANGPEDLAKMLIPRVARGEWDVVAQLAVQIMDKSAASGAERVLRRCLDDKRRRTRQGRDNIHGFIWRCLSFARVSEALVRDLIERSLVSSQEFDLSARDRTYAEPSISYSMMVMPEALSSVSRLLGEALVAGLESDDAEVRESAASIIGSWADEGPTGVFSGETITWWRDWVRELVLGLDSPVLGRETDIQILHCFLTRRIVEFDFFAEECASRNLLVGDYVFADSLSLPYGYLRIAWGSTLLNAALQHVGEEDGVVGADRQISIELETVARHFPVNAGLPIARTPAEVPLWLTARDSKGPPKLESSAARWGLCVLVMMVSEDERSQRTLPGQRAEILEQFTRARSGDADSRALLRETLELQEIESEFVRRWALGEISLTSGE